ncbi:winged-helix domain-containing protein [Micromonospora haikouensis]|uniref:winged-helix domain-containing protein n=1 Tax=Micromonospora haikouensis TaxID=686309 RepID=UPI0037ABEC2C
MNAFTAATMSIDRRNDGRFVLVVVDDDDDAAGELAAQLAGHRVHAHVFANAAEALLAVGALQPDAAIVDAGLTSMASAELVRVLACRAAVPTVVGIGGSHGSVAVDVLSAGATACVRRPYRVEEVVSILRAIRPDTAGSLDPPIEVGALRANPATMEVHLHNRQVTLPMKEFRLLYFFMTHTDRLVTRQQLISAVWDGLNGESSNTLTVHIKRLRQRLSLTDGQPPIIVTVRGMGYRFQPPPAMGSATT